MPHPVRKDLMFYRILTPRQNSTISLILDYIEFVHSKCKKFTMELLLQSTTPFLSVF